MQKWIIYICAILILTSIFQMLTPNGAMNSIMKFILNLFLISLILTPIFKNISSNKIKNYIDFKNSTSNENWQKNLTDLNKKSLENAIKILLKRNGFNNFQINLNTFNNEKKSEIIIKMPSKEKNNEEKLRKLIKNETGIEPTIYFKK